MTTGKSIYEPVNPHMTREQGLEAMHRSLAQVFNEKSSRVAEAFPIERYDDAANYLIRARDTFNKSSGFVGPLIGLAASIPGGAALYSIGGGEIALIGGLLSAGGFLMWGAARGIINANGKKDVRQDFKDDVNRKLKAQSQLSL